MEEVKSFIGEHRGHIASVLQLTGEGVAFVGEICPAFAGGKILGFAIKQAAMLIDPSADVQNQIEDDLQYIKESLDDIRDITTETLELVAEMRYTDGIREIDGKFEDMLESDCNLEKWANEYTYDRSRCKTFVKRDYNERNLTAYLRHIYTRYCHNDLNQLFSTFDMLIASRSKFLAIETTYLSNSYDDNAAEDTEACMSSFYNDMDDLITSVNQVEPFFLPYRSLVKDYPDRMGLGYIPDVKEDGRKKKVSWHTLRGKRGLFKNKVMFEKFEPKDGYTKLKNCERDEEITAVVPNKKLVPGLYRKNDARKHRVGRTVNWNMGPKYEIEHHIHENIFVYEEKERIVEDGEKVWKTILYMTFDNETLEWEEGQGDNCESDNEHEELNDGASEDEQSEEEESENVYES